MVFRIASSACRLLLGNRRRAAVVVAAWVAIIGVLAVMAPTVGDVTDNDHMNDPPATSASMHAARLAAERFPVKDAVPAIVVVRSDQPAVTRAAAQSVAGRIAALASDMPQIGAAITADRPGGTHLSSRDGLTEMIVVPIEGSPSSADFRAAVHDLQSLAVGDGVEVAVTGPAGIASDAVEVFGNSNRVLLLGTLLLVVLLVFAIYRSPAMVLVALLSVGVAMRLTETAGALMADAGWFDISSQTASIMTVLLFGVGTDYVLIINARYRESLADTSDLPVAMMRAMRGVAASIASSASTVVLAMMALLAASTPALVGFGPYLAIAVASMALVAFTFTPALLLLFGRGAFWPRRVEAVAADRQGRVWGRVANLVLAAPRRVLAGCLLMLSVMALGLIGFGQTFDLVSGFRVDTDSAAGQQMITESFGPGAGAPATVYVVADDAPTARQWQMVAGDLADTPGVAAIGPQPDISPDGTAAAFDVTFADNPYGPAALDRIAPLTAAAGAAARAAGITPVDVTVGGETARAADIRAALDRDMILVAILITAIVAAVLAVLLRSLLAPLYLIASLALSVAATLGVTTFITVTVLGDEGIGNRVAAYVFIFLMVLGVDYTIFIMSRYRQELARHAPDQALRVALVRTGGVVSSAGVILAGTFAVLMTQPIRELFQFGLAMAIGILLDTFIVRPMLIPAVIRLLGDHALWPTRARPVCREAASAADVSGA